MDIVLFDDEELFLQSLEQKIKEWAMKNGCMSTTVIHSFTSSEDMLEAWNNGMRVDALFLDIQIPNEMNGMAVAKEIYSVNPMIPIIFITSFGEYAEEGYVVNALRYIRKPITEQNVNECMDIVWHRWMVQQTEYITFDLPTQILRLPMKSILYVEVSGHYCVISSVNHSKKEYKVKQTINNILQKLPPELFAQCHRSYIVNLMYVRHITSTNVTMADNTVIQMGRNFKSQFVRSFRRFFLEGGGIH